MDWQPFAAFAFAFITEVLGTAFAVMVSRNNLAAAMVIHNAYTFSLNLSLFLVVGDRDLILFTGLAEAIGGTITLYLSESKSGAVHDLTKRGRIRLIEYSNSIMRRGQVAKRKQKPRAKKVQPERQSDGTVDLP